MARERDDVVGGVWKERDEFDRMHGIPSSAEYQANKAASNEALKGKYVKGTPYLEMTPAEYLAGRKVSQPEKDAWSELKFTQDEIGQVRQSKLAPNRESTLPKEAAERKHFPVVSGVLDYFPDAIVAVAEVSYVGNMQHNPGQPLHWDRSKSTDEVDALGRHLLARGTRDADGLRHSAKLVWRAMANLQKEIEAEQRINGPLIGNLDSELGDR